MVKVCVFVGHTPDIMAKVNKEQLGEENCSVDRIQNVNTKYNDQKVSVDLNNWPSKIGIVCVEKFFLHL